MGGGAPASSQMGDHGWEGALLYYKRNKIWTMRNLVVEGGLVRLREREKRPRRERYSVVSGKY